MGHLVAARRELLVCANPSCPAVASEACTQWLSELETQLPSVVIGAYESNGRVAGAVVVSIDGVPQSEALNGKAFAIDPGPHLLSVEVPGKAPVNIELFIARGEKNREIDLELPEASPTLLSPPTPQRQYRASVTRSNPSTVVLVLGGVGVVGLGAFAFFGASGKSDAEELRRTCAPACAESEVGAARSKLIVADISLGASILSLGAAGYLLLSGSSRPGEPVPPPSARLEIRPVPGGATAGLTHAF